MESAALKENEHGRLIFEAATRHLAPIGCRREGRSRTWRSDQGFWLIGIEFQPSDWDRGSYLNVGACWLWCRKSYFPYDSGPYRIGQFITFRSADQFRPLIDEMAITAARQVIELRRRFRSIGHIADELAEAAKERPGWPVYHAAISAGLSGRVETARSLFAELDRETIEYPYQAERREDGRDLAARVSEPATYRLAVLKRVQESRSLQKLEPLNEGSRPEEFARLLLS